MSMEVKDGPARFAMRLKRMDSEGLKPRDVLILFAVISRPGMSGLDVATMVAAGLHGNVRSNVLRLERKGYIEDRRSEVSNGVRSNFHPTPAGRVFWDELKA